MTLGKITLKIQLPSYLKEKKNTRDTLLLQKMNSKIQIDQRVNSKRPNIQVFSVKIYTIKVHLSISIYFTIMPIQQEMWFNVRKKKHKSSDLFEINFSFIKLLYIFYNSFYILSFATLK